jgi:hypothetical protein
VSEAQEFHFVTQHTDRNILFKTVMHVTDRCWGLVYHDHMKKPRTRVPYDNREVRLGLVTQPSGRMEQEEPLQLSRRLPSEVRDYPDLPLIGPNRLPVEYLRAA